MHIPFRTLATRAGERQPGLWCLLSRRKDGRPRRLFWTAMIATFLWGAGVLELQFTGDFHTPGVKQNVRWDSDKYHYKWNSVGRTHRTEMAWALAQLYQADRHFDALAPILLREPAEQVKHLRADLKEITTYFRDLAVVHFRLNGLKIDGLDVKSIFDEFIEKADDKHAKRALEIFKRTASDIHDDISISWTTNSSIMDRCWQDAVSVTRRSAYHGSNSHQNLHRLSPTLDEEDILSVLERCIQRFLRLRQKVLQEEVARR
ncbi:hypothetical protein CYLTODRAFT_427195 [Cylindrobasidium torrendii FP15055 ss-10]|uniref:Uncharacterized protein n=1 Tax=Cylindrobasidium torrendii FP15055 ss-10 TaxID=1314674 RepID=A0A0D7AUL1_9AGAR|nr:hypothetical protein CYLTODRAFT_427195 [Cylindrobasidium torrendii FP15055 ss-10]